MSTFHANRRVLVTGGNRGIGKSIAVKLIDLGYEVHIIVKDFNSKKEYLEPAHNNLILSNHVHIVDLSDPISISEFVKNWNLCLWAIVNNAAICKTFNLDSNENDPINEIISTNLLAPYYLTKSLLYYINRPGRIINISSQLGVEGRAGYSAYSASKFGLIGMTKCWAKELGIKQITVNAICPGWVSTDMSISDLTRIAHEKNISYDTYYKQTCEPLELKRFNEPVEVANFVAFLLSDEASGITGRDFLMQTIWNQF